MRHRREAIRQTPARAYHHRKEAEGEIYGNKCGASAQAPSPLVATGRNVWGILNAPATGEALAELIVDGAATSTDLAPFDPTRLRPLDPAISVRASPSAST